MNFKKYISFLFFSIFLSLGIFAQITLERQVIGTTGGTSGTSLPWGTVDYTVGEAVIKTFIPSNGYILTQGFHQPTTPFVLTNASVQIKLCKERGGSYSVSISVSSTNNIPVTVNFLGNTITLTPPRDTTVTNLTIPDSTYIYNVSTLNTSFSDTLYVNSATTPFCRDIFTFYNGITPNGDGYNDTWIIDGIEDFSKNRVLIFNRWGNIVWSATGYDNTTVVWNGKSSSGADLTDATYFYIVEVVGESYKGWVELTH